MIVVMNNRTCDFLVRVYTTTVQVVVVLVVVQPYSRAVGIPTTVLRTYWNASVPPLLLRIGHPGSAIIRRTVASGVLRAW